MISIIAVIGKKRELGKDGKLLWHLPGDLARFKRLTMGHPVVMGRKTYESLPEKFRPLAGRTNVVITNNLHWHEVGVVTAGSWEEAVEVAKKADGSEEIFVIGGGSVYKQAIEKAQRMYLTLVDKEAEADTFFPEYDEFGKVVSREKHEDGEVEYEFVVLERE